MSGTRASSEALGVYASGVAPVGVLRSSAAVPPAVLGTSSESMGTISVLQSEGGVGAAGSNPTLSAKHSEQLEAASRGFRVGPFGASGPPCGPPSRTTRSRPARFAPPTRYGRSDGCSGSASRRWTSASSGIAFTSGSTSPRSSSSRDRAASRYVSSSFDRWPVRWRT
jgi:hypothetical protein